MTTSNRRRGTAMVGGLAALALALSACGGGGGGADAGGGDSITFLIDNTENSVASAEQIIEDFEAANPDITVELETRPQGGEGDNVVKTRLATGEMTDVFAYNSGSLFQQISPEQNVLPVTDEPFMENVSESFKPVVSVGEEVYGVPLGAGMAGGILYNKKVYEELGLEVPTTWDEFMANNEKIKEAGKAPIIQTYQTTWTSQLFVLGDFANVAAADPNFAEDYTANEAKYATHPAAIKGFEHQEEAFKAGMFNEDFASAEYGQGLEMLTSGEGVHYPILTFALAEIAVSFPEQVNDLGLFPLPGEDAEKNPLTIWLPGGVYISKNTENPEAAKKFLAYLASKEGCDSQTAAVGVTGPYLVNDCELPEDVPTAVKDMLPYFEDESRNSPALEFLSPVKGPALEQIAVEVGSGIRSAKDGAALYDQDVEKQAQQLNLPGWS